MDDFLQLIPLILIALFSLLHAARKKMRQRPEPEVVLEDDQEERLSPWSNFPIEEDTSDRPLTKLLEVEEHSVLQHPPSESPAAEASVPAGKTEPPEPGQHPVSRPNRGKSKSSLPQPAARTIAGISLTPQTFRQGIILSELLGRPKSRRRARFEDGN